MLYFSRSASVQVVPPASIAPVTADPSEPVTVSSLILALKAVMVTAAVGAMSVVPNLGEAMIRRCRPGRCRRPATASVARAARRHGTHRRTVGWPGVTVWVTTTGSCDAQAAVASTADMPPARPKNFRRSTVLSRIQRDTDTLMISSSRPPRLPLRAPDGSVISPR